MKPGAAEHLGGLRLPQPRTQQLQTLDDVADQIRELVDGLLYAEKGVRSFLIDPRHHSERE
jgi:hypothetical protein